METDSRIDQAMQKWAAWEQRLEKLSPGHTGSREHMAQKLAQLEVVRAKHLFTNDPFEKLALQALKREQRKLERSLYPNLVVRLLRRLVVESDIKKRAAQYHRANSDSQQHIYTELKKAGLERYSGVVAVKMRTATSDFSIPLALATGEKEKMDLSVHIKYHDDGLFRYAGFQASLKTEGGKVHSVELKDDAGISVTQAYQLVQGRAVYREGTGWMQLDFTDKDAMGNLKIRHVADHHGFDVSKALEAMPLKLTEKERQEITERLKQGEAVTATYLQGKTQTTVSLEAAPARGMIRALNGDQQPVSGIKAKNDNVVSLQKEAEIMGRRKSLKV